MDRRVVDSTASGNDVAVVRAQLARSAGDAVVDIMFSYAAELVTHPESTIDLIVDRYGMSRHDARTWLQGVEWPSTTMVDTDVLDSVVARMVELGRIEEAIPAIDLV